MFVIYIHTYILHPLSLSHTLSPSLSGEHSCDKGGKGTIPTSMVQVYTLLGRVVHVCVRCKMACLL